MNKGKISKLLVSLGLGLLVLNLMIQPISCLLYTSDAADE